MEWLIKNRKRDYSYQFPSVMHHAMKHVTLKRGLNKFKENGEKAVSKELLQIHTKRTFRHLKAEGLTYREKYKALEYLMFLKEKRDGSVKGQSCTNVRKQRPGSSKEDATSPAVSLEAALITYIIGSYKEVEVAIINIPRALLTSNQD